MIHSTTLELSDGRASRPATNALVAASLKASPGANRQPSERTQPTDQRLVAANFKNATPLELSAEGANATNRPTPSSPRVSSAGRLPQPDAQPELEILDAEDVVVGRSLPHVDGEYLVSELRGMRADGLGRLW
jgi:hypothetical protein